MRIILLTILFALTPITTLKAAESASLEIVNNSQRVMTVKVMEGNHTASNLYNQIVVKPFARSKIYISQTGNYFVKTKASINGKDPIYQKGNPFHVVNDETGYSVLTLTYTIKESAIPEASGGKRISQSEFDRN